MVTTSATVVMRAPALSFQWTGVAAMTATVQLAYRHRRCLTPLFVLTMATTAIRSLLWAKLADSLHGFEHAPKADLFELQQQLILWLQQPWPWAFMVFLLVSMTLLLFAEPATLSAVVMERETGRRPRLASACRWASHKFGTYATATLLVSLAILCGGVMLLVPGILAWSLTLLVQPIATFESTRAVGSCRASARLMSIRRQWIACQCGLLWLLGYLPCLFIEPLFARVAGPCLGVGSLLTAAYQALMMIIWLMLPLAFYLRLRQPTKGLTDVVERVS